MKSSVTPNADNSFTVMLNARERVGLSRLLKTIKPIIRDNAQGTKEQYDIAIYHTFLEALEGEVSDDN